MSENDNGSKRQSAFLQAIEGLGLEFPVAEIARKTGYSEGTVSPNLKKTGKASTKFIQRVSEVFGFDSKTILSISPRTGERTAMPHGWMNDTTPIADSGPAHVTRGGNQIEDLGNGFYRMTVELVSQKSAAGYLSGWGDQEYLEELPTMTVTVKQAHKGTYRGFEIAANNNSMDDGTKRSIEAGDVVIDRLINRSLWSKDKLHLGKWKVYTIVHRYEGITTKEIINHNVETGVITCHSWNPDKELYPDFELNLADVFQLWNVVKIEKNL